MDISLAICTFNRAESLDRTLAHLDTLRIPEGLEWELLVVNNGCTDHTDEVIARHQKRLPLRRLFEPKRGLSPARNLAIDSARGGFIFWTDDDALPHPDWLVRLYETFQDYDAEIVFGRVEPAWESGPPAWYSSRFMGSFALLDYGEAAFVVTDPHHPFYGVNMATRRRLFSGLGGFREDLGPLGRKSRLGDDSELFLRALGAKVKIVYQPQAVVDHIIPATRCSKTILRRHVWNNRESQYLDLLEKHADNPWLFGLPRWFFRDAITHAIGYVRTMFGRQPSENFFHELRLRRFLAQWFQAALVGVGLKPGTAPIATKDHMRLATFQGVSGEPSFPDVNRPCTKE